MSTSVDERVVQMRFDNAQFESGVQTSLSTLDRLKQALRLDGIGNGLDQISSKANGLSFDGLSSSVDAVGGHFSALETIATGALLRIGSQVEQTAERMVKSLTIDNISAGFNEYELKMGSIQTIMAGTGESLETVNGYLNELNEYSDRTIYSFSDMTNNIGKFTNAGVSLKDSVAAIQGVANVAAISGANAQQASHAMYNFAQALSSGYVKLIDWKSIENANMATVGFKDELLASAEALGTVKKQADGTYKTLKGNVVSATLGFNDSLKDQWMTTDVLTKTLARYTDETTEIGKKAMAAATEVKTFSMMIDTVKEAVGSSWAKTWELIFGDFEEGKQLWTGMEKVLENLFVGGGDEVNHWLQYWHDSIYHGRKDLLEAFKNLYDTVRLFTLPIKVSFREIFGLGADATESTKKMGPVLVNLTNKFKKFTETLAGNGEWSLKVKQAADGLFSVVKVIGSGIGGFFKMISPILGPIKSLANLVLTLAANLGQLAVRVSLAIQNSKTIQNVITQISNGIKIFCGVLSFVIDNLGTIINIAAGAARVFFSSLAPSFAEVGEKIKSFLKPVKEFIQSKFGTAFEDLGKALKNLDLGAALTSLINIFDVIKNSAPVQTIIAGATKAFDILVKAVTKTIDVVKKFVSFIQTSFAQGGILGVFKGVIKLIGSGFDNLKNTIRKFFSDSPIAEQLKKFSMAASDAEGPIKKVADAVKYFVSQITPGKIAVVALSAVLLMLIFNISKVLNAIAGVADAITDFFGIFKMFAKRNNTLMQVAVVIGVLAASLYALSTLPTDKLKAATDCLLKLIVVTGVMTGVMMGLGALLDKLNLSGSGGGMFMKMAVALLAIAGAAGVLTLALIKLQDVKVDKALVGKVLLLVGIMAAFALITRLLGSFNGATLASAATILAFAYSIKLVVDALMDLSTADMDGIDHATVELIGIMASLALLSRAIGSIGILSGVALLLLVVALSKALPKLEELAGRDYPNIAKAIKDNIKIITLLGGVVAAMAILGAITGGGIEKFGKGMIKIAVAVGLLGIAVYAIGKMKPAVAKQGMKFLAACLGLFALLELISALPLTGANMDTFGKGMIKVAVACLALAGVVAILGGLESSKIKKGTAALASLLIMLGIFQIVSAISARIAGDNTGGGLNGVVPLIVGVAALAAELIALSFVPWGDLKKALIALISIIGSMSLAMLAMSKLDGGAKALLPFIGAIVLLASITGALYLLAKQDWKSILGAAASIALVAVGLSGALYLLAGVGVFAQAAIIGIGLLDALLIDLVALIGLIGKVVNAIGADDAIEKGIEVIRRIGSGLGAAIGDFIANLAVHALSSLPLIGMQLSLFAISGRQFFNLCKDGTFTGAAQGVSELADVFIKLAAGDFINAITSLFGGGTTSFEEFGTQLKAFGSALVEYSNTIAGNINAEAIQASADAAAILVELANTLPNTGGLLGEWLGENDWGTFSTGLVDFGQAMVDYSTKVTGLDVSAIEASAKAGTMLADLANTIPNSGGKLADFFGDNTWNSFRTGLVGFGVSLSQYAEQVTGLDVTVIEASAKAGNMLTALANTIPNSGGLLAKFFGDNDMSSFGKNLSDFGYAINNFAFATKDINPGNMSGVVSATEKLIDIATTVQESGIGERKGIIFKSSNFGDFGKNLTDFANQINNFAFSIAQVDPTSITAAVDGLSGFVKAVSTLNNVNTTNITNFANSIKGLGTDGVNNFCSAFTGADLTAQTAVDTFIGLVVSSFTTSITQIEPVGHDAVTQFNTGVGAESELTVSTTAEGVINTFIEGINTNMGQLEQCGRDAVQGFIDGVNLDTVRQIGNSLGVEFLAGVSESTGWNSPWTTMQECASDAAEGMLIGIDHHTNALYSAGFGFGDTFLGGFRESLGWYCTPHKFIEFLSNSSDGLEEESNKSQNKAAQAKAGENVGNNFWGGVVDAGKQALGYVGDQANKLANEVGGSVPMFKNSKDALSYWENYLTGGKKAEEANEKAAESTEKATEAVKAAGTQVDATGKKVKAASRTIEEATTTNEKYFDIMSFGGDVVQAVYERFGAAYEGIGETSAIEASKSAVEALALATYEASQKAETAKDSAKKSAKETTSTIEEIKKSFLSLKQSISSKVSGQMDIFKEFSRETKTSAADMLKNMRSQVEGVADWSNAIQELAAKGIDQGLLKKLAELGPQGYDYVNAFVQMTGEELQQANALYATSLAIPDQVSTEILASYAYAGSIASGSFMQGMQENSAQVGLEAAAVANSIKTAFDTSTTQFVESGALADQNTGLGITDNESVVETASNEMLAQVGEETNTTAETVGYNAGTNLGTGLARGIREGVGAAIAEAQAAMSSLNSYGVEAPQEINSPSKVWAEYGRFLDLGLAQGLSEYSQLVTDSGMQVGEETKLAMQNALTQIPLDGLTDDMQPVITPVLDLTNVQNGAGLINGMIGSQTYGINATANIDMMGAMNQNIAMITDAINSLAANQNTGTTIGDINVVVNAEGISDPNELANVVAQQIYNEILSREAVIF